MRRTCVEVCDHWIVATTFDRVVVDEMEVEEEDGEVVRGNVKAVSREFAYWM